MARLFAGAGDPTDQRALFAVLQPPSPRSQSTSGAQKGGACAVPVERRAARRIQVRQHARNGLHAALHTRLDAQAHHTWCVSCTGFKGLAMLHVLHVYDETLVVTPRRGRAYNQGDEVESEAQGLRMGACRPSSLLATPLQLERKLPARGRGAGLHL